MTEPVTAGPGRPFMVKPNCTITTRHKDLLRKLAEERYGTQSGALRAAIEKLHMEVSDGKTATEDILDELQHLREALQNLESGLDEISSPQSANEHQPAETATDADAGIARAFNVSEVATSADIEPGVYDVISTASPITISEIADQLDEDVTAVHRAVAYLMDRNMITSTADNDSTFIINTTTTNND